MRLSSSALLCLATAAAVHLPLAPPAYADSCEAGTEGRDFPVRTRIHGGPDSYESGGGYGVWYLDLTNATRRTCGNIHPVVILVDQRRVLRPRQTHLEFYAGDPARPHPVRFERTDADELVGVFDGEEKGDEETKKEGERKGKEGERDPFPGFTVAPGETFTVKVRLAVTSDAGPNEVTAGAAVVQRKEDDQDDGEWVGQSNDYRFAISTEATADEATANEAATEEATADHPSPSPGADATAPAADATAPAAGHLPFADELARSGRGRTVALATTALLLIVVGALLVARKRP
ncbi:hypothetical protein ABZ027_32635 [Streptomyces sp. NPDC006332]|uniref:hypothetical protein n=1 Tax=Streptomyces sp. NPDC006332 TaxID=3155456 RepID=UPI0033A1ECE7